RLARRAFLRLAAFLCRTPLATALSRALKEALSRTAACWGSLATAASNFLRVVFTEDLTMRLRRFFFALTFTRFIADLIFGNLVHLLGKTSQRIFYHGFMPNASVFLPLRDNFS